LHYTIMALGEGYQPAVVTRGYIDVETKKVSPEIGLAQALQECIAAMTRSFPIDGTNETMEAEAVGIDVGYMPDVCYRVIREHPKSAILRPTKGESVRPGACLYRTKDKRSVAGEGWIYAPVKNSTRPVRLLRFDSNHWKTFTYNRCIGILGAPGSMSFNGPKTPLKDYFAQISAEYRTPVTYQNRTYDIWEIFPGRKNHYLDTLVGCCILGNYVGVGLQGAAETSKTSRKRKKKSFKLGAKHGS